jgi:iron(III) transport system substrate-binding protein
VRHILASLFLAIVTMAVAPAFAGDRVVNVYAARHHESDKALYEQFGRETGITVNVTKGSAPELLARIGREAEATQADVFITVDGGVLHTAKSRGLLQPVTSAAILQNVPEALRDRDGHWIGLSTRARVIVYSRERVRPDALSTYEDLASPAWRGKVLARPADSLYDQSLVASFIALDGKEKTRQWLKAYVGNFARPPKGNDRAQIRDIAAGLADVALVNSYYIGQMLYAKDPEEVRAVNAVGVFFPNQQGTGVHINISGAGVVKYARNRDNALRLIEFLTRATVQEKLSAENYEFPVNPAAKPHPLLAGWGAFKIQQLDFSELARNNALAIQLAAEAGWK